MTLGRVGFASGYDAKMTVEETAEWMTRAEDNGFEIGFFSETARVLRDGPSALAAMSLKTNRMRLGVVQVVRLRSPVVMAQTIATIDELSGGRLMISPGACGHAAASRHGLPEGDPAQSLIEFMEAIRLLLSGNSITYKGETLTLDGVGLGWQPRRQRVPLYPASTSRKGLRIAGAFGDGVVLDACTSPEYSANAVSVLRDAAESAGRNWSKFETTQIVVCSIEDDIQSAVDAVRWEVASKLTPASHRFQRYRIAVGEPHMNIDHFPKFSEAYEMGGMNGLIDAVPDSYVLNVTASGTPGQVVDRVEQYRAAGVQLPILRPAAAHQAERLISLFGSANVSAI